MTTRGFLGATTAENTSESILQATQELLQALQAANDFAPDDLAAIWFTATPDLTAAFPARAAC
ncbi:MAG: chorismate mutase [Chloroflexi bacterium]|nr:chorismate mutase [Chloroflexota bacterium]